MPKRETTRTEQIRLVLSKEEKDLFVEYAKEIGINPSRLARNLILMEAESLYNNAVTKPILKSYVKFLKATNNIEALERLATP